MSKPGAGNNAAAKPGLPTGAWSDEPAKIVCAGLALAVLALAFRIASVW